MNTTVQMTVDGHIWRADVDGDGVDIWESGGRWCGKGTLRIAHSQAHIDDCPAVLPDGVYEALEDKLTDAIEKDPEVAATKYIAVAGQNAGTCAALHWASLSIAPFVLATGDDEDEVLELGIQAAGHDDVHVHRCA